MFGGPRVLQCYNQHGYWGFSLIRVLQRCYTGATGCYKIGGKAAKPQGQAQRAGQMANLSALARGVSCVSTFGSHGLRWSG